jgi:hypothetical protein
MAVFRPMPRARVRRATIVKPGVRAREREAVLKWESMGEGEKGLKKK